MDLKPCGTYAAYQRHIRRGEPTCDECRAALSAYVRNYRKSTPERIAEKRRQDQTAKRALARIRDLHYAEYLALLAEERSR